MKLIESQSGKELHLGDIAVYEEETATENGGTIYSRYAYTLTEDTLPFLLKKHIVEQVEDKPKEEIYEPLEYYLDLVSASIGVPISNITQCYPAAALCLVLRAIAEDLDDRYPDHISKSPEIYTVSTLDGRIYPANKAHIKNYNNFAAFRSIEDAKIACRTVRPLLKQMFKNDIREQKD